jgi:trimethylamine-N-oxide reductase cytochrome c-type subunit TorC
MLARAWNWLRRPSRVAWSLVFIGGAGLGAAGLLAGHAVLGTTNSTAFCVSCHEMEIPLAEYMESAHFKNPSGVRAGCPDCHVPESGLPYLWAKVRASKDLYHHLLGTLSTPEAYEEHRLALAQGVWDRMRATDSRECRSCHAFDAMDIPNQRADAQKNHPTAIADGSTCIDCHKGIAHKLPDMKKAFANAFQTLKDESASVDLDKVGYSLETLSFSLAKGADKPDGRLLPASRLEILAKDGDQLNIRISGWRQEGADTVVYGDRGKRILVAALTKPAAAAARVGAPEVDPETDQTWMPVTLDAWLPKEGLTDSIDPVWAYADQLYVNDCAVCHVSHHTDQFLANQWIGQLKAMERFSQLDKEQNRLVLKYLQYHAKDAPEGGLN